MQRTYDIFAPGRVCLFGEHSDWAGGYRRINSEIPPGRVIIAGTNQGAYARAKAHPDSFIVRSVLPDGTRPEPCILPMKRDALLAEAQAGGFYSYAAGVAYTMLTFYHIDGIEIDNYRTTLPVQKGLSSSASFCVLTARAFNKVYDLRLTVRAEMETAYQGEILTPSRCGRMDQGCAYGQVPVLMTFDGDMLRAHQLSVRAPLLMLIADLGGSKDTIQILADLNRAYPFASDQVGHNVQEYLGPINTRIVEQAVAALEAGDAATIGHLMTEAQESFDRLMTPASPEQLSAPKLHAVLGDQTVQRLTFGGKGVGSQGDGSVQFVARDAAAREELATYLRERHGMACLDLDLLPPKLVRKAVIPVAGFGTRMFPASKAIKKELFPVVTPDGMAKPIILAVVEEAVAAGIEEIALVVRPGDEAMFTDFFCEPLAPEHHNKLSDSHRRYLERLHRLGRQLTYITQEEQSGFGHAVHCARDWVGDEPFLLMLGDHLYLSDNEEPCARQLIEAFESNGCRSIVGVYEAEGAEVVHYGTVAGTWADDAGRVLEVREIAEKPSLDYARQNLLTECVEPDRFLCLYGQYVLTPAVFRHLGQDIDGDRRSAGEIQLTTALEAVRKEEGLLGFRIAGEHYDTGLPGPYVRTLQAVWARGGDGTVNG